MADRRWDALPAALADLDDQHIDTYFSVIEMLLYHGQTRALFDAMDAAWDQVSASGEIISWGVDEFGAMLMQIAFYGYLEDAEEPHAGDPMLVDLLSRYLPPDLAWFERAVRHLSAPTPSPWQAEDFWQSVDAERWADSVDALLFEFVADRVRQASVPLSRGTMARDELRQALHQQLAEPAPAPRRRSRRDRAPAPPRSSLLPRRQILDRLLAEQLELLSAHPYRVGATLELLPAYLHFLARLDLIRPQEMDRALNEFKSLATSASQALDSFGADVHMLAALQAAWSDDALDALRQDPALAAARERPPAPPPSPVPTAPRETLTFKGIYERQPDAWFTLQMSARQTLDDLHYAILDAADFDRDHLYSFYMSGRAWDRATEHSLGSQTRHSSRTPVGELPLRLKQRFLYLYDYGDQHHFDVQLVATGDQPLDGQSPRLLERHGEMPPQYPGWEDEEWDDEEDGEEQEEWEDELDEQDD